MKIRVLGFSCADRNEPDVPWLVRYSLKAAEKFGRRINELADVSTELIDLADKEIRPCGDCQRLCIPNRGLSNKEGQRPQGLDCPIKDDYMAQLITKVAEADAFVFGSSVSNFSYSTKFRLLTERLRGALYQGYLSRKPATALACGYEYKNGGQLTCMDHMDTVLAALEMIPFGWGGGAVFASGPPFTGRKDFMGLWLSVWAGRKITELAVMLKLARQEMIPLYNREFMHHFYPPQAGESWFWNQLDKEDEELMMKLEKGDMMRLEKAGLETP